MSDTKEISDRFDKTSCALALVITVLSNLKLIALDRSSLDHDVVKYCLKSFGPFNIMTFIVFLMLYLCITYIRSSKCMDRRYVVYLIPSLFFSVFAIEGHYFESTNAIDFFTKGKFYTLECILVLCGYTSIYFVLFSLLDILLTAHRSDEENKAKTSIRWIEQRYEEHPFIFSFILLSLLYIPVILISYPAFISWDAYRQIAQAYNIDAYVPYINLIDDNVKLFNHHPICHTLLIYCCLAIGTTLFKSWNIGIFIYVIVQTFLFIIVVSYCIHVMIKKFEVKATTAFIMLLFFGMHPKFQLYIMVVSKDMIYVSFFMLFLCSLTEIVSEKNNRRTIVLWYISMFFMMLFRNDGFYIIIPVLLTTLLFAKRRRQTLVAILSVFTFFYLWNSVLLPFAHITPGSKREMLSIPFQQTARYTSEYRSDMTEEEVTAVSAILPIDKLAELYNPDISDPIKSRFNEDATSNDLKRYFKAWYGMFKKHPEVYFRATLANKYQMFYPSEVRSDTYSYSYGAELMEEGNELLAEIGTDFRYPAKSQTYRKNYENYRELISNLPVLDVLCSTYFFILIVIFMLFLEIRRGRYICMPIYMLFVMQIAIMIAGPCNGHYFRYTIPIACSLPLLIAVSFNISYDSKN